jgi:DNA integrity scanning protein DisA with diadenylate cyclase activity
MAIEQVKKSREEDIFSELLELGESYGVSSFTGISRFAKPRIIQMSPELISRVIEGTNVRENALLSVLEIANDISNEGREGEAIGTAFIVGDSGAVLSKSKQLVMNPFEGHAHEKRLVTNPEIWDI